MADTRLDDVLARQLEIVEALQRSVLNVVTDKDGYQFDDARGALQNLAIGIDKLVTLSPDAGGKNPVVVSPVTLDGEKVGQVTARIQTRRSASN